MAENAGSWCGDAAGFEASDEHYAERGSSWIEGASDGVPAVRHPIGFVVGPRKPVVRVKAWSRPVINHG